MQTRHIVRRARLSDMDRILEIERASFGAEAYDRKLFAEYQRKCGGLFLAVEERRGRMCGYMLTCARGDRAELVSVAVDPKRRGRGAASALLDSTLRRLRRRSVSRLLLMVRETNQTARSFYEKYGFRKIRRAPQYYEDGGDGLLMAKSL